MSAYDVIVAGAGISGLLLASELAGRCSVCLLEQAPEVPRQKYWLTDSRCISQGGLDAELQACIGRPVSEMEFVAFDGTRSELAYDMRLWDTDKLTRTLVSRFQSGGGTLLTGRRFYTYSEEENGLRVKASKDVFKCRLLIDCMGFSSPIAAAYRNLSIFGFYLVHGHPVRLKGRIMPVGLHNAQMQRRPSYFELFPSGSGLGHAAMIASVQHASSPRTLAEDLAFVLSSADYADHVDALDSSEVYSGIIPVGKLRRRALNRVFFYGEAGQANPAASATALTRMLASYRSLSTSLIECLSSDKLGARSLTQSCPQSMSSTQILFHQLLYKAMLRYTSVDFRRFVEDMQKHPDDLVGRLIFGDDPVGGFGLIPLVRRWLRNPNSILRSTMVRAALPRRVAPAGRR